MYQYKDHGNQMALPVVLLLFPFAIGPLNLPPEKLRLPNHLIQQSEYEMKWLGINALDNRLDILAAASITSANLR